MTREEVKDDIITVNKDYILAQLPTGFGKTKIALDKISSAWMPEGNILIVVPRNVLIENWKDEFKKWHLEHLLSRVTFVNYMSLHKYANMEWGCVIFDEAHHLSQRCVEILEAYTIKKAILLSASVSKEVRERLFLAFPKLWVYKVPIKDAIQNGILPDPKVYIIPLTLDNTTANYKIIKNASKGGTKVTIPYKQRWKYAGVKSYRIEISCTQKEYYEDMSSMIEWYKRKMFNDIFKNMFLRKSGDRLKWLSAQKSSFVKSILTYLKKERTLTFCNSITQTEELGKYYVNSKNKDYAEILDKFNTGAIQHITACNMLDEGVNLVNCRIGVYAVLNSSDRMIKQKLGRLLRHPHPIIIIPYYKDTREEDLVKKMLEDYNPQLVKEINNINEIEL